MVALHSDPNPWVQIWTSETVAERKGEDGGLTGRRSPPSHIPLHLVTDRFFFSVYGCALLFSTSMSRWLRLEADGVRRTATDPQHIHEIIVWLAKTNHCQHNNASRTTSWRSIISNHGFKSVRSMDSNYPQRPSRNRLIESYRLICIGSPL